jgi:hypothetical protein
MGRLQRWFARPSPESPAETLRWVQRMSIATAVVGLPGLVLLWATGGIPLWLLLVLPGLLLLSVISLGPPIRDAERKELDPSYRPPPLEQRRRRGRRAGYLMLAVLCLTMPIVGYAIEGLPTAIAFLVGALVSGGLGVWLTNRILSP